MKKLFKVFTAFFYLNSVAPAFMYYIYDENPNIGYVAAVSSTGPYKNRMTNHKKYFIGSNNQKYMKLVNERAVDSHFAVLKSPPKPFVAGENQNYVDRSEVQINTANFKQRSNIREDDFPKHGEREVSAPTNENVNLDAPYQDKEKTTPPDTQPHIPNNVYNYNQREYIRSGDNNYEKKQNIVAGNGHRASVSKEQKVVKPNNPQLVHQSSSFHQRISGTGVKDKILHKASTNDRITMSWNTDMAPKSIMNMPKMDGKKRETFDNKPNAPNNYMQSNSISDNVKNYLTKDMNNYNDYKNNIVHSRIGNHEELVDMNETPYAVFYRMNPEHLDEHEVLIENPLGLPSNGAFGDKVSWDMKNQENPNKSKSKRAPNIRIHKKVKNHTSYRNN